MGRPRRGRGTRSRSRDSGPASAVPPHSSATSATREPSGTTKVAPGQRRRLPSGAWPKVRYWRGSLPAGRSARVGPSHRHPR
jgi:hypothetical protein